MDSGVRQPTDFQVRIIFADGGCIPPDIEKSLIKDTRVRLKSFDLLETTELFDASIIIGSDFPADRPPDLPELNGSWMSSEFGRTRGKHATSWHVWYDEVEWTVSEGGANVP